MSNNKELHAAQDLNQALQHEFKVRRSSFNKSPPFQIECFILFTFYVWFGNISNDDIV
jgi:hypothetical protein